MLVKALSQAQLANFDKLERVGAAFSLCGTAFVLFTFLSSTEFQKPINRLIFYACLGNVFMSIASIIAREAITSAAGNFNTFFCQFQALLVQMFLPADALWTFVMALNVYLTFFRKFDAASLRRLEKWYFLACYGLPFIPAFIFVWITRQEKGHFYGDAALWCWISNNWEIYRIGAFYGPVWLVILATIGIYIYAGKEIYKKTKMLRHFNRTGMANPADVPNTAVVVTTAIQASSAPAETGRVTPKARHSIGTPAGTPESYDVTITGGRPQSPLFEPRGNITAFPYEEKDYYPASPAVTMPDSPTSVRRPSLAPQSMAATTAMLSYTRVAVLFFIAMMMTWIPSSANRVYSVIYPGQISLSLECFSAFVLPLQGLWNAIIYAVTSIDACKSLYHQIKTNSLNTRGLRNIWRGFPTENELFRDHAMDHMAVNPPRSRSYDYKNESQAQLKESRPQTGKSKVTDGGDLSIRVTSREEEHYQYADDSFTANNPAQGVTGGYHPPHDYSRNSSYVV